jgi:uncharacterized membrane protein YkoI
MKTLVTLLMLLTLAGTPVAAQSRLPDEFDAITERLPSDGFELVQEYEARIAPSEAAAIAQDAVPGAKVLRVRLLPSGVYAVTLRAKGSVIRVMVSAEDGSIQ